MSYFENEELLNRACDGNTLNLHKDIIQEEEE